VKSDESVSVDLKTPNGPRRFHVGTDVGGTFTDLWAIADDGQQVVVKSPSTPDIISGILGAIGLVAEQFGVQASDFCRSIDRFGHGTTAGLNALLTGRAARTAVITTDGFRDTLEIGRLKRQVAGLTELQVGDYTNRGRLAPIVPRQLVFEVSERIDRDGQIGTALDEDTVTRAIEDIAATGVQAVAVCLLWSVANPVHEIRIGQLVAERLPGVFVSLSHEVAPGIGEYARMSTTAINAALGPVMGAYLANLDEALRREGLGVPVQVMTGAGGVVPATDLAREPVAAMMSGPAAGVIACQQLGELLGISRLLTVDVGGTSFDVGVVVDGKPLMRNQLSVAGADIKRAAIDVGTIGAGGGSIARVEHGVLMVGPQSAGAVPGPVCYGRGGRNATATDADLVLGVLGVDGFAGGTMRLSRDAAEEAIAEQIGAPLSLSTLEAAWGIRQVLDSKMSDLLRSVTIERGHDPREFVMFANGGQGPSHAWALCRELGISTFIVTPTATAQSALGTGTSDLRQSAERPCYVRIPPGRSIREDDLRRLSMELGAVDEVGRSRAVTGLKSPAVGDVESDLSVAIRYRGQSHHLDISVPSGSLDAAQFEDLVERFEVAYESLFGIGSAFREAGLEALSVRSVVTVKLAPAVRPVPRDPLILRASRKVVFDDPTLPVDCPVWSTECPAQGQALEGPALVVFPGQTLVVPPGAKAVTDEFGNFVVTMPFDDQQYAHTEAGR
jgi:N-methylhydantoinase A